MPVARSLRGRVLVWAGVALTVLFAVTTLALDLAFTRTTDRSREELLSAQLLGLLALADADERGHLRLPADIINPQFTVANSGLYGVIWSADGEPVWESQSLVGRRFPRIEPPPAGEQQYAYIDSPDLPRLEALVMGINWELDDGSITPYTIATAVSLEPYEEQQQEFRRNLIGWFTGITVIMLVVILGVLGWVLRPVSRLAQQVREVEDGDRTRLTGEYPTELIGLASNLNALIETERRRLVRYRHTLDDLAHSLKTPLAAMRTLLSESRGAEPQSEALNKELDRMTQRVSYQLRRARAGGSTGLGVEPVKLAPLLEDLRQTLDKVYRDKLVRTELRVSGEPTFQGDPGDLTEILGNLLDNAYKFCRGRVIASAWQASQRLIVTVDDDGPGMSAAALESLVERGTRADETLPGQGIGLAVVRETAELYSGSLGIMPSELGGSKLRVELGRAGAVP